MEKEIRPYKQKKDTCAIACMMMVLEYCGLIDKANWYEEKRYYKIYHSKYMTGTPFSALAYHFSKNGLDTTIYHSEKNLFENKQHRMNETDFALALKEYREFLERAEKKGTKIVNGFELNSLIVKEQVEKGKIVILAGEWKETYHAIVICGYDQNYFIVCHPLYKTKQRRTDKEIDQFMNTSIGKWLISVDCQSGKR